MNNSQRSSRQSGTRADGRSSHSSSRRSGSDRQTYEHYLALAREKSSAGERIEAENYYQHAEHYFRLMAAHAPRTPVA
ncbi:DUF4167 domain-containing protein [Rhizobium sp. 0TCS1.26]|uniref:DUF4167 domain-containing protein n=1 Tax=Rhizobium sp. 0TCS1.26 TaxID=3142623 RepID=UPI003D2E1AC6